MPIVAAMALGLAFPAAARSAWARLLSPWGGAPRYTFAALEDLPSNGWSVAHGEPFSVTAQLAEETVWHPSQGEAQFDGQPAVAARSRTAGMSSSMPSQLEPGWLTIKVGDASRQITHRADPASRADLAGRLGERCPTTWAVPARSARTSAAGRSRWSRGAAPPSPRPPAASWPRPRSTASRASPRAPRSTRPETPVKGTRKMEFRWQDTFGLEGKEPFTLAINGRDDEAPSLACEDLPRQKVVLDSELLAFKIHAQDDFGVRRVGMEWQGMDDPGSSKPAKGERILGRAAATTRSRSSWPARSRPSRWASSRSRCRSGCSSRTTSPAGRGSTRRPTPSTCSRPSSTPSGSPSSSAVAPPGDRGPDREMQLHETNKQLRALAAEELDKPENRRKIENQAVGRASERPPAHRPGRTRARTLVREAMRNPEFGVGHLEKWAEMLQILKDISGNRMPTVADLLKEAAPGRRTWPQASQQPAKTRAGWPARSGPRAAASRPRRSRARRRTSPVIPRIADMESSQNSPPDKPLREQAGAEQGRRPPPQRLPVTTVMGKPKDTPPPPETPAEQKMDEAVRKQRDLLAEFEKIADELNRVLANLEGSTLVKRLKAASRLQYKIGGRIGDQLGDDVRRRRPAGRRDGLEGPRRDGRAGRQGQPRRLADHGRHAVVLRAPAVPPLQDRARRDAEAGRHRQPAAARRRPQEGERRLDRPVRVLVRHARPLGRGPGRPGVQRHSAQAASRATACRRRSCWKSSRSSRPRSTSARRPASPSRPSPRSRPRSTSSRPASSPSTQKGIQDRTEKVTQQIRELPDGESEFPKEIALLDQVAEVMGEAAEILDRPETGSPAIGAETEAIELLLQSKRINPKGGGGGGSTPGGGGKGRTHDSALALIGGGVNEKEVREDHGVSQATGESGPAFPEEFRAGLDEYFNRLEKGAGGQ